MHGRNRKKLHIYIKEFFSSPFVILGFAMFSIMLLLMYIVYITEKGTSTTITSFFDVIWYTLVTIATVGYGDVAPITRAGRLAGMFLLLFGVIIFGGISGKVASILFDAQL